MNAPEHVAPPPNATAVALLPIAEIMASRSNPRKHFDDAYIAELADSIKSHGLIQPITVRPLSLDAMFEYNKRRKNGDDSSPRYELVVGECRWRAAKQAGYTGLEEYEDLIRRHLDSGYALPDEFDGAPELDRAIALLRAAPLGRVMAMMLDEAATEECRVHGHNLEEDRIADSTPHLIAQLTRRLGAPFASLTHPASTPSEAAPAGDKCAKAAPAAEKPAKKPAAKKAEAKADRAPASPANEAAAPPKTSALTAWPFPIGART